MLAWSLYIHSVAHIIHEISPLPSIQAFTFSMPQRHRLRLERLFDNNYPKEGLPLTLVPSTSDTHSFSEKLVSHEPPMVKY